MSLRRSAWMAIVALGTLAWVPARAQTPATAADLSIVLTDDGAGDPIAYGAERGFTATIANAGPSHASSITLTVTLPTPESGTFDLGAVSGCVTKTNTADGFTCTVADIVDGATATVSFSATLNKPVDADGAVVVPGACPSAALGAVTASVATDPAVTEDLDPANNTSSTAAIPVLPWAELSLDMTGGTSAIEAGGTVTYTAVVTNNGPCTATGIVVSNGTDEDAVTPDGYPNPFLNLTSVNGDANAIFSVAGPLAVPDLAAGAHSADIVLVYTAVGSLPEGVNGDVVSMPETLGALATMSLADDDSDDASAGASLTTPVHFGKGGSGCSSVGGLDLLALLGVAGLGLRRRRQA